MNNEFIDFNFDFDQLRKGFGVKTCNVNIHSSLPLVNSFIFTFYFIF